MNDETRSVVVGHDGSKGARASLRWAAGWAAHTGRELIILEAVPTTSNPSIQVSFIQTAEEEIAQLIPGLRETYPELSISSRVMPSDAAKALVRASRTSDVVVGSRGHGAIQEILLGSVSAAVATHAHSNAVIVVPEDAGEFTPGQRIVVGFDGSTQAILAARWAFSEAARLGVPVVGLTGRALEFSTADPDLEPRDFGPVALAAVQDAWQSLTREYTSVEASFESSAESTVPALLRASHDSCLVAVGSRGKGGFEAMLLGSTSRDLLRTSQCVAAIIRNPSRG